MANVCVIKKRLLRHSGTPSCLLTAKAAAGHACGLIHVTSRHLGGSLCSATERSPHKGLVHTNQEYRAGGLEVKTYKANDPLSWLFIS